MDDHHRSFVELTALITSAQGKREAGVVEDSTRDREGSSTGRPVSLRPRSTK
jgi:hypothetical protein